MSEAGEQMMGIREVCRFFGGNERPLDQSTIYRWVKAGKLAPSVGMGPLTKRWKRTDCQKALDAMAAASQATP